MTVLVWTVTFPIGLICPILMKLEMTYSNSAEFKYLNIAYMDYSIVKVMILVINLYLHGVIFKEAVMKGNILKTCLVSFALANITSAQTMAQIIVSDLQFEITYPDVLYPDVALVFSVINSYQIIPITAMFVMLVQNQSKESLTKLIVRKLTRETV